MSRHGAPCSLSPTFAGLGIALLAVLVPATSASAQLTLLAHYPLAVDLLDATNTYGPMMLTGSPPPAPPANGVCVNGVYFYAPGGQDAATPPIGALNANDFQIDVEFSIAALPGGGQAPIFMAGNLWRWIGFYVQANGILGLKYNNSNFTWSTTTVATGTWYSGSIRYEAGAVEVWLNGALVHQATLGPLNTGNNLNFTTNDYSVGRNHNGCIRNVSIYNDTTLGAASTFAYGTGCDGLTLGANGVPSIGNAAFELVASYVPATPLFFVAFGTAVVNPGIDLTAIGMAGCFSYTSFDLGLFGPAIAVGGTGSFSLPIPNTPSLAGASLASQAVSLSTATAFGLASSNGLRLVLGF
jgi:hypothetical protein